MEAHSIPYTEPNFQELFTGVIHNDIYRHVGLEPKPPSLTRAPRGCQQCHYCNILDAFLSSPTQQNMRVSVRFKYEITHLNSQFVKTPYAGLARDNIEAVMQFRSQPYTFDIKKIDHEYENNYRLWINRFNETESYLVGIGSREKQQQLLGQRFHELLELRGVVLVRRPDGMIVTPPTYLHERVEAVEENTGSTSNLAEGSVSVGTVKRKNPMDGQENCEPNSKRRVEVIDLLASP